MEQVERVDTETPLVVITARFSSRTEFEGSLKEQLERCIGELAAGSLVGWEKERVPVVGEEPQDRLWGYL